jgi:CubicO group peptidase (beta-lactamase class C family)
MPNPMFAASAAARSQAFAAVAALLLGGCARAPQSASPESSGAVQQARHFADSVRLSHALPGFAATVTQRGRVIWSDGFGFADRERGIPATPETKFRVGSVSKLFTAVALMRLVDAGALDLDAPVSGYLERYPPHWPPVTLRQLGGHTAGVRHYRGSEFFSRTSYATLRDAIEIFLSDSLLFAPGTRYAYSSYGYNLIGAVLEAVVREPFPAIMERLVFAPLGMSSTVPDSAGRAIAGRAALYRVNAEGVSATPEDDLSSRWPSGGYLSTTADLTRFANGVTAPGFLSRAAQDVMFTPQRLTSGDTTLVGIGWRMGTDSTGRRFHHHGGSSNGGAAFLLVYPNERLVIALASNAFANWSTPEALHIAALFLR